MGSWKDCVCLQKMNTRRVKLVSFFILLSTIYFYARSYGDYEAMYFRHIGNSVPCVIPEIDPFDPKMMEFIWNPGPLKCDDPAIVNIDNNNNLQFNKTALKLLNETPANVTCDITLFERFQDDGIGFVAPFRWQPSKNISRDFFRAICSGSKGILYDSLMTRIQRKTEHFQKISDALEKDKYNVILFGLDSVSRSTAIRQLPNMYKYLTDTLGGYDFKGYMKVADNTFVNIVPLLTGKFAYTDEIPIKEYIKGWLDNLPLIWKDFSNQKCLTMLAEDHPNLGMFNMDKNGFYFPPTDHYMRPFWKAKKKLMRRFFLKPGLRQLTQKNNLTVDKSSGLCTADKPNHVVVMDYLKQFLTTYKDNRKFCFSFLTELAHDYQNVLQLGDNDLTSFFEWLSQEGFLNDSVLFVFSDHGLRFGNVQHLHVARIENRMPFLSVVIPDSMKQKYPELANSLKINQQRLTTPFDLHATLRDILHGNLKHPGSFKVKDKLRGISIFQEIPESRSCSDASIAQEFCACYKTNKLDIHNNPLANKIAESAVSHINKVLRENKLCSQLKLHNIIELNRIEQGLKHAKTVRSRTFWSRKTDTEVEIRNDTRYSIVLETLPGNARFYVTCDVYSDNNIKIFGNVDRVNKYGNQSSCVHEYYLKNICYCTK